MGKKIHKKKEKTKNIRTAWKYSTHNVMPSQKKKYQLNTVS